VKIDLVVRGICCLQARHSRVVGQYPREIDRRALPRAYPHLLLRQWRHGLPSDPKAHVYIGSADMMPRNLDRRVEALVPLINRRCTSRFARPDHGGELSRTTSRAGDLLPDGTSPSVSSPPGGEAASTLSKYFMTNPSLSGRGKSLKESAPKAIAGCQGRSEASRRLYVVEI
jgi:polyphosphate kinase